MASTCAITLFIKKKFLGFSLYKDLYYLTSVIEGQKPPVAAVIGGVKASSKMSLLRFLAYKVDKILIGGAMVFTFYKALDFHVGGSYVDEEAIDDARRLIELCKDQCSFILAPDAITIPTEVKKNSYEDAKHGKISVDCRGFPIGQEAMDVGNRTIEFFKSELDSCNTIFFNGKKTQLMISKFMLYYDRTIGKI
jgi:phosphoglycerate kinase